MRQVRFQDTPRYPKGLDVKGAIIRRLFRAVDDLVAAAAGHLDGFIPIRSDRARLARTIR
jgi:hypothetical protein